MYNLSRYYENTRSSFLENCGLQPYVIFMNLTIFYYLVSELNNTTRSLSDNYIDSEEDVLYQKDASFSAELEVGLVPSRDSENLTSTNVEESEVITTTPSFRYFQTQNVNYQSIEDSNSDISSADNHIDSNTISNVNKKQGTPLYSPLKEHRDKGLVPDLLLSPDVDDSAEKRNNHQHYIRLYKEIEGTDGLVAEEVSTKDLEDQSKNQDDNESTLITTTLGPSLEQKVKN